MTTPAGLRVDAACAAAAEEARAGRLDEALAVLDGLGDADEPRVLDLRARVLAQRGDHEAADRAWGRLDELVPGDPAAAAGRAAVRHAPRRRTRRRMLAGAAVLLVAAGVATTVAIAGPGDPGVSIAEGTVPGPAAAPAAPAVPAVPAGGLPDPARPSPGPPMPAPAATAGLAAALAVPGAVVRAEPGGVVVRPADGLFRRDAELTSRGAALLDDLAARLRGRAATVEVTGGSVAVAGGPQTGGTEIALQRATAAAGRLAAGSGVPLTAFRVGVDPQVAADPSSAAARSARSVEIVVRPS